MALSPHVEVEAAKFLQKLIQESRDEPVKLATKLFVICHHMKLSGKEHSLPYQVISRAMETVLAQHGLDRNVLRSSSLVLASGSLSADVNSQSTKPGNESRMSGDTGSAEVQKAKGKDMSGTSSLVDTDTLALRSRAIMGNEKAKEVMDSTLRTGPFTSVGSSVACQMGSSGNDSSKYGPKDTKKDSVTDYNRSSKLLHTDASCFEYSSVQNSQSLEAESSAVRTLDGSKNLDLQRKDSIGSDVQPSGKCLVEGPGKKAPAKRKRAASGTSLKDDRPLTRQQRKQMSFEINEGKQEVPTNDCISAEEETQASKVFQPPCPVSHNDKPQLSSAFSRVAHTQGLLSQVTCAVDKNFVDGNACVLTMAGGGNVQVSQAPSLDFNGHFGRDIKQMYKPKEPSSERDSPNHLKQGNEDIPISDVKFDGTVIQSSDQTFHDEPFKPPTSQQTDLSCMPEHLQAREPSGAQANVNVSSGGLSLVNFGCNVPCQKMIRIDTMPPFGAASGTSLKDDHPQMRQQESNLSFGTNESNQEVVTKDYISADGETKDVKSFQLPCPVPQNDQPQFSSTFSKVPDTQGLHFQVTCAVDMNFVHVNASHLTKVGGGNGELSQAKTVSFDGHFGRDIKQMLKTTEASSDSDASDHLKPGNKGMLADPRFNETTNQSSDKTPHDEPFKSPTDQQTDLSCMPEHLRTKDSSGVKAMIEIPSGGPSLDDFGCNVACQIMPGIDTMPHNGAQGVQESSHRPQSSQSAKESTEKTVVPQKYKDPHFNISKEMQDSSANGLKCPLKDSSESAQIVSNIGIWNQTKVDTASQMSAVPIVPSNPNVQHSVIDSIPPAQEPPHGISDQVSLSPSKGLGSDNAQSSPATSGKHVTMFPKYQADEVGNDQVSINEQHHAVAHTSWAMKEEMAPRLGEVESSIGVSDVGLCGQSQSPMDLGPDNHSVPVKMNNGSHSFRVHVHHAPGTENSNSDSIPCQARATHASKVAPNEQLQQQSSSTSRIVSNVSSLSNELVCKKSLTFSNVMIDNEEGKLEQVKTPVLSESDRSLDAHLCSTADRGEGCLSTQKSTGLETRVLPPLTNQCRVSQDISRHTSSSHQIGAASAQGGGKLDAEASAEQRMQRNDLNGGRENVSTIKSVSTGLVNDAKSESNVTIESMKADCSSSQNNPNHGFVVQVPFFPNSPFRDYQLKQLRAQCLVFLAFRNKIPPKTAHLEVALDVNNTKIKAGTSESETGKNQKHGGGKEELFEGKACEGPSNAAQERKMMESKETETEKPLTPKLTPVASCSGSPVEAESSSKELEPTKKGKRRKYPRIDPNLTKEERKQVMAARRKAEAAEQAQERAKSKKNQCKSSQLDSQSQIRVAGLDAQPQSKVAEPDAQPQTKVAGLDQQPLKTNVQGLDEQIQTKVAGLDAQLQTKIAGLDALFAGPDAQLQIQVAGPDAQLQIQVAGPDAQLQTKFAGPDAQLQTKVAGRDAQLQTKVAVPDAQLQIKVAGPDAQPQTNVAGLEAQPQTKVPELDAEPQTKVPGLDAEPQTSVVGLDAQSETKVAGLDAQPETKVAGPDVQPETNVAGLDAQPQTEVAGPDAQPQSKVAGPETLPQTKVTGLETLPQTQFTGTETLPQSKVEIVALVKTQEDSAKITSNPQEANENNMSNSVPSSGNQLEIESSRMLVVGGSHASAKDNCTIADGKQTLDIKKTEEPIMNTQDTDGKKQVNTTHVVSSPNLVAGSRTEGLISSSPKNRMIRLPNGESITLERFMQIAKSMKFPMMAQNTGVLTKPVMGESTASGSESLTAKGMSESYSQLGGSFPQHAGKQASLDVHWKTSSSATINNGALPINSKFQNGNQYMAVDQEEKDSSPEDSPAFLSKPSYTTVEKWILDQRKRKQLEEQNWAQKQRKTEAKIAVCFHHLKEVVSSSEDISAKTKSVIELKKLQLLQLQRRLRGPGRRMKQLERLELKMKEERQRRARERQKEFFSDIEAHKEKMDDWYKIKRERYRGFNRYVKEFHKRKDRTYREKVERIQREKINLLKNNDVEGYLRMVQDAKSDRVKQLLKETEGYIQKLGLKLQKQKVMAKRLESEMDETRIFNEINGNELGSTTTEENDQAQHYLESNEKYYLMAHSVKEIIYEQPYSLEGGKLREYQMNGLRWLVSLYNNHLNGILADEMGLGKTVQVIALICYLMETKNDRGPFLVVVPSSVLSGWVNEISFWAPSISKIAYMGSPDERRRLFREKISQKKFNVLLTTYEYLMNKHDRPKLSKIPWHYVIIDEGHRIKNASCKLNAELKHYQSTHRLLLTGTPLQNNLEELWALLNFLLPNIFNSSEDFSQWFSKPFENVAENSADQALLTEEENLLIINRLHQVLRPFMLRRLKHKVENELPEKIERLVRCEASAYQKLLMKRVEENLGSLCHAKGRSVHNTVMELRNICNHPYLSQLHSDEVQSMLPPHYLPPVVRLCAKLEMLDRILPKLKATNHRVLLFSTMTRLLDVMEEYLAWKGYQYLRLDGHTSGNDRGALIEEFNRPNSEAFLFLLSIRAGGVGINLQAADTVIIFDTDWNPQVDLQAQARAHRIGQKRDVLVLRFETVHTVEEQVRAAAEHKLGVANQSITAGFFDNNTSPEDRRVYLEELLRGSKKEEDALVLDDEALNYLLARSESEIDIFEAVDGKRHQKEREEWLRCIQGKGLDEAMEMPPRLVVEEELKPLIMAMQAYDNANAGGKKRSSSALDTQHYGRGKRAREVRSYGDQLTEEEFERLCQAGVPDSPKNNDLGKDARKTKSAVQSVPTIGVNEPLPVKRGRGRPRRVPLPSVLPQGSGICSTDFSSSGIPVSTSVEKIDNLSMSSSAKPVSAAVKENHDHPNFFSSHSNVQGNDNIESNVRLAETSVKNTNVENAPVFSEKSDIANGAKKDISFTEINVENAAVFSEKSDIANGAKKDISFAEINVENAAIFSEKSDVANGAKKDISFSEINVEDAAVFSEKSDIANGVTKADNEGNSSIEKEIDSSNFGDSNEQKNMMCNVATEHVLEEQDKHNESIQMDSTIHKKMDGSIVLVTNDMQVIDGPPRNSDTSMLDVSKADFVTDKGKEGAGCQEDTAGSILNRTGSACPETNNPGDLVSLHADIDICAEQQVEEPINNPIPLATDIEVSNSIDVYKH